MRPAAPRPALAAALLTALAAPAPAAVADPDTAAEVRALNEAAQKAVARGDYGAALTAYRQAIAALRDAPDAAAERSTAMFLAAVCLEKLDRPDEALAAHREALDAGLPDPLAGKARARIERLEAAAAVDPVAALARLNARAKAAVKAEDWATALSAYREAIGHLEALPERAVERATTWFLVGVCLDELGRRSEALDAYATARALGPPPAIAAQIDARLGPAAPADGVPVTLACTPADLEISVPDRLDRAPCAALTALPPGTWTLRARAPDGREGHRTVQVEADAGAHHFSLFLPPPLTAPPPAPDRRAAWVLTLGAAVSAGAGGALMALESGGDLGESARPVGIGLLGLGGALGIGAIIAFAAPGDPRLPATPPGWGPSGAR